MAPKKDDGPSLILRVEPRAIVPAAAIDAETLGSIRYGSTLQASVLQMTPSIPLRAYWALLGDVVRHEDKWVNSRALSNAILIEFGLIEEEYLLRGGVRRQPMSLKDFSDDQLWLLIEKVKHLIVTTIIPGVDIKALQKPSNRGH